MSTVSRRVEWRSVYSYKLIVIIWHNLIVCYSVTIISIVILNFKIFIMLELLKLYIKYTYFICKVSTNLYDIIK